MKQLQHSLATLALIGLLATSCTNLNPAEQTRVKSHLAKNPKISQNHDPETFEAPLSDYILSKETIPWLPNLLQVSHNFELAHNSHLFTPLNSRKELSFITAVVSVLLTLSLCKLHLNSIDNESYWFDSEIKRMKKNKKSSFLRK